MKKRAFTCYVLGILMLASGLCWTTSTFAGVSVGIGINLPVFSFAGPPELVVIPGTYAYTVPDAGVDIIFYHDYWYRPFEGRWYRSRGYNGPWAFIDRGRVPGFFLTLPPDYRHHHAGYERIPYGQFKKNWRGWERDRHWDRHHEEFARGHGGGPGHDNGRGHGRDHARDDRRDHDRGDRHDHDRGERHGEDRGRY